MPLFLGTVRDIPVRALKLCGLTWSGEFLWFSEAVSGQIMALDPVTGNIERRIACTEVRTDLTTIGGNLVQIAGESHSLRVIDPVSGHIVTELSNPRPGHVLAGIEATRHGTWFGYQDLKQIDLRSGADWRLIDTIEVDHEVAGVTVSDSYLAYSDHQAGSINVVDVHRRREIACFGVAGNPTGITWDGSRIWYCDHTTLQLRAVEIPGMSGQW